MKKGLTLLEVVCAIAVFSIMTIGVLSSISITNAYRVRQYELMRFSAICQDIDKLYTELNKDWPLYYTSHFDPTFYASSVIGFTKDFEATETLVDDNIYYYLDFKYVDNTESGGSEHDLVINVYIKENNRIIIKDLNYGGSRYETK